MTWRDHATEAVVGLAVVVLAGWFLMFAAGPRGGDRYALTAHFANVAGVNVGTDVRLAGVKVGEVTAQALDPASFQAVLTLAVDSAIRLPADSSAAITADGLLGGAHIALIPGAESETLAPGDRIEDTQGATDLMGLIGSVINRSGAPEEPGR